MFARISTKIYAYNEAIDQTRFYRTVNQSKMEFIANQVDH